MKNAFGALALLLGFCSLALAQADDARLLDLVAASRGTACPQAGAPPALQWSPALARVAERVRRGEAARDAVQAEGYRATRLVRSNVEAPTAAEAARVFAQDNCKVLADANVSDFAYVRNGSQWTVLVAAPLRMPQIADTKAASQRVLALLNDARRQGRACAGQPAATATPLRWSGNLEAAAAAHAKDMARKSSMDLTASDGSTPPQRLVAAGYKAAKSTELVASGLDSPERVAQDWLSNADSCKLVLEAGFSEGAVALETNPASKGYVYWALVLAAPDESEEPPPVASPIKKK